MALTTAAEILCFCDQTDPSTVDDHGQPQNAVLKVLYDRGITSETDTSYIIFKAQLLYEIVRADVTTGGHRVLCTTLSMQNRLLAKADAHRQVIVDALTAVQRYKEEVVRRSQKDRGAHWGSSTCFNMMDWTDLNEAFLRG